MDRRNLWALAAALALLVGAWLLAFSTPSLGGAAASPGDMIAIAERRTLNESFVVSGTVTCKGSGLSNTQVFVWKREQGDGYVAAVTGATGAYSITLPAGSYDLIFNPRCRSGCASYGAKGISGPHDQALDVRLPSGRSVYGTVYATDRVTTISQVAIYAFHRDTADGFGLPPSAGNGTYCVSVASGVYEFGFAPPPCRGLGPARAVVDAEGDVALNIYLPEGFTVGGKITDGAGAPAPGTQIYARQCGDAPGYGFSPSKADGYYSGTLPLGEYGIQFLPPAGRGLGPKTITDVVKLTNNCPNTTLDVTLPAGLVVSGRVACDAGPLKNVFVHADPIGPPPDCYDLDGVGVYTVDDGSYVLPLSPSVYNIAFVPPPAAGTAKMYIPGMRVERDTLLSRYCRPALLPAILRD